MKLTILIIIAVLGVIMPLLWITGTLTSMIYFFRHWVGATRKERGVALNPQLGLTMADGGDPVDKEKKESAAVNQVSITATPQVSQEQIIPRSNTGRMFWWER